MDPDATLARIRELASTGDDDDELLELVEALETWLAKGGFAPSNSPKGVLTLADELAAARMIALA